MEARKRRPNRYDFIAKINSSHNTDLQIFSGLNENICSPSFSSPADIRSSAKSRIDSCPSALSRRTFRISVSISTLGSTFSRKRSSVVSSSPILKFPSLSDFKMVSKSFWRVSVLVIPWKRYCWI